MKRDTSELQVILGDFLKWNKARLACLTQIIVSLFLVKTVNLKEIAVGFCSSAQIESRYKRIKRFFSKWTINLDIIAHWIFKLFGFENKAIYLTIDRTNWFWGKAKINMLTLAVVYEGMAIPLLWTFLDTNCVTKKLKYVKVILIWLR